MSRLVGNLAAALLATLAMAAASRAEALSGRVVDARTGAAVAGASVILGDREQRSDGGGRFQVDVAPPTIRARAPGYLAASVSPAELARSGGALKLTPFTPKAVYLSVYGVGSSALRGRALALVRSGVVNALVIDLKGDRGLVPYPSKAAQAASPAARQVTTIKDLAALARSLHGSGVYLIARIVTFKDDPLAAARPDLAVHRAGGGLYRDREGLAWTDPFRPEVQAYNLDLAVEAAQAGFDEVQFDYLRFPDSAEKLAFSKPTTTQAARTAAITGFLAEARRRLTPYNTFLAADIFGYVCWNRNDTGIGQDLEDVAAQVDYLSPMLYPSGFTWGVPGIRQPVANSYGIVHGSLVEASRRLQVSPKRFRPWLQAFRDYAFDRRAFDADEVAEQIRAADEFGSDGWMLWNPRNSYGDAGLAAPPQTGGRD